MKDFVVDESDDSTSTKSSGSSKSSVMVLSDSDNENNKKKSKKRITRGMVKEGGMYFILVFNNMQIVLQKGKYLK